MKYPTSGIGELRIDENQLGYIEMQKGWNTIIIVNRLKQIKFRRTNTKRMGPDSWKDNNNTNSDKKTKKPYKGHSQIKTAQIKEMSNLAVDISLKRK